MVRVSDSEKEEIAEAARRAGANGFSAWVRALALREARQVNRTFAG